MQKVTGIFAVIGVVVVATALLGLTYAQLATPNPTVTPANPTATPWWSNGNPNNSAPYCYNNTAVPPYCYNGTDTDAPYRYSDGYGFGCHGYGYGAQGQSQYGYGGMMGRWGMHGRGW